MYSRIEYLQHEQDPAWEGRIEEERERIRQENISALNYSIMWVSLAAIVFALVAQLFNLNNYSHFYFLLIYIEALFLISIVILVTAGVLFWHGSSTDHSFKKYAELNENGDSLVMFGSLILITGLSLLCSYILLEKTKLTKELALLALYGPIVLVTLILLILNRISIETQERGIITHYIIEAARFPFYRQSQKDSSGLIKILRDEKETLGLIILASIFIVIMIIPYFLITR